MLASLRNWLDSRTGYRSLIHEALYERIPGGARWRYVWGSTLVFAFVVQVITGMFLWMAYSPSAQTAWESVYYIQNEMQGGWLLRGLHHFMSQAMIVLLLLHLMQVVIDGAYRAPREVNFWLGLVLMMIVLGLSLTGYLLPWDQKGYWATRVATNLMGLVSNKAPQLVIGGPDYGHHTLTRFFALHAGVLPALLVAFLVVHVALFRRHGISAKMPVRRPDCSFWPDQVLKDAVACLAVLAVVLFLIVRPALFHGSGLSAPPTSLGAELGAPADPSNAYSAARPEWYFLFLFQFLKLFEGWGARGEFFGAIVAPGLIMLAMFLMPIFGRWKLGHRFNILFTLCLLAGIGWLTASAYIEDHNAQWADREAMAKTEAEVRQIAGDDAKMEKLFDNDPTKIADFRKRRAAYEKYKKSADYLSAVSRADEDADRVKELAGRHGIPPTGALTILADDSKTQGDRLFTRHCASCHAHLDPDSPVTAELQRATAPNLYGFGTARWISGVLDPKQIKGPNYFGATAHNDSEMTKYVENKVASLKYWKPEEIKQVIGALVAEAAVPNYTDGTAASTADIKAGQVLIKDTERCAECHRFHDPEVSLGAAPDLTGYGSRQWLTDFIGNPAHQRFYGDTNDRMPGFAKDKDPHKNRLTAQEIQFLVEWLRGEWDEEHRPE